MTTPFNPDDTLAARIKSLSDAHPWMDPSATVTLAGSDTSDQEVHGIADALRQQVSNTWDGISHFFDDPVLGQKETPSLALKRYLTNATGTWPVEDRSLTHIQSELQAKGFGKDLAANGVWDSGWQAALQQHAMEQYHSEIGGNKTGSVSSHGFLHGLLSSLSPSGAADAIVGFVKSIPSDVRQLASDAAGTAAQAAHGAGQLVTHPGDLFKRGGDVGAQTREVRATGQVAGNNLLGGDLTKQQAVAQAGTAADFSNLINDVGTVFLLTSVGGAAKGVSAAVARENGVGLATRVAGHAEAQRSAGVIAKSLMKPVVNRTVTGAAVGGALGGAQAAVTGGDIGRGIGTGAVVGGALGGVGGKSAAVRDSVPVQAARNATDRALAKLLPDRYYQNLPIAGHTGPIIGKLAHDEGLYYKARTKLASPYEYGGVRVAGQAFTAAQVYSLKAHAVGYLETKFGGGQAGIIQQAIDDANALDPINDALDKRLAFTAAGTHFSPDLDYLMFFLHGPTKANAAGTGSRAVGDSVKNLMDGYSDALGHFKFIPQIEQGTGVKYADLLRNAGGDPNRLNLWMGNKTKQAAAYMHAERLYARAYPSGLMPERFTDDYWDLLRAESNAVWRDPDAMKSAVAALDAEGENYLQNFIKEELTRAQVKPNAYLKHELGDYLDAGDVLTHRVLPHADQYLLTPKKVTRPLAGVDVSLFPAAGPVRPPSETISMLSTGENEAGSLGLARDTTLTSQQAVREARGFGERLADAAKLEDPVEREALTNAIHDEMNAYLFHNFGMDARKLAVFSGEPEKALSLIGDRARHLASEVQLTADAPEELKAAFSHIESKGYKVVSGTDIGHVFRNDLAPLRELGAPITRGRRIAQALGVSPEMFSRLDYGVDRRLRLVTALQTAVDEGRVTLPPYYTVQTLINDLQDDKLIRKQLPYAAHVLFSASRRAHQGSVEELMRLDPETSPEQAMAVLETHIASAQGLRNLSFKDFKRVLGRTDNVPWVSMERGVGNTVEGNTVPLMNEESIREVFKAVQQGFSQTPAGMLGASKVEDFLKYLPFRGVAGKHLPFGITSLPTSYARLRDAYRFTLSPYFDLRRIAKTNVKMAADGVVPTAHPVSELRRTGAWDDAHSKLDQLLGETNAKYQYLDEADRYLDSTGIFGLYNPRHYEAYYVAQKMAAGVPDAEIKEGIVRVFQYGTRGREGRTALERTANTIFFPFSFEKTVLRNIGGYLLDKPAQAMVISNALNAYREFDRTHKDNPLALSWVEKHAPLMEEFLRLNTFAHGISPGELGGVNRPLMNMFLPQSWATTKNTTRALERFVPLAADLHRIVGETADQKNVVTTSLRNGLDRIANGPAKSSLTARPVAETARAQQDDARVYRSQLISAFQDVLDYNAGTSDPEGKITWGLGTGIPEELRGQPISKTTLAQVVHDKYPAYDPMKGADYAIQKKVQAQQWISKQVGRPEYDAYKDFYAKAETAIAHLNRDEYPIEQAAQVQDLFRQAAIDFAEKDAGFYTFYQRTFASAFGPLTKVR